MLSAPSIVKSVIILPAFNESQIIEKVIATLPHKIKGITKLQVLVVDDGSMDSTAQIANDKKNVIVLRHIINRGLGAAIKTALQWAKKENYDIAITFDSDGQHDPGDIEKVVKPIIFKKADLVIGSRFKKNQNLPSDRKIINWLANFITFIMFGVFSSDSQSGLRAFSKKAIELIDFKADRMEFSSEILVEAKRNNLKVVEVPIKAIYTNYSRAKGQKNTNALPIFTRLLLKMFR